MTAIYDPRAARAFARGEAAKAHAEAEAVRAEIRRSDRAVEAERSRAEREHRREMRRQWWQRTKSGVPDGLLSMLWATVIVSPLLLAWRAQAVFAADVLRVPVGWSWLFPLAIESGAWVCAFEAHRRARRGLPAGALPRWMWLLAGIAAGINAAHGTTDGGPVAGLALGALSVLGVLLHHIRTSLDADTAGRPSRRVGQWWPRWVLFPVLAVSAVRVAVRTGAAPDAAWEQAHRDRFGVASDASRRDRRLARVITRRQARKDCQAARRGEFTILGGVILATPQPALTITEPATDDRVSTPIEQQKLTPRAAALLDQARQAIQAGELPERPSANALRKRFGGAMETAQEVRDALTTLHPIRKEAA